MNRRKSKKQNNAKWVILGMVIILFFVSLCSYIYRPLPYEDAVIKANEYHLKDFYCSGYSEKSLEVVFRDKLTGIEEKTISVVDVETAKRIYNEFNS